MKPIDVSEFSELERVFSAYLHEDFLEDHKTPAAALRAFLADANATERRRFRAQARLFLDRTRGLELDEVSTLIARLGCRWTPPSRSDLTALLTDIVRPRTKKGT